MRGLIIAIAIALAAGIASPALACTVIIDPPPPGLSDTEMRAYYERQFYDDEVARQQERWKKADYVFLAEVRSLRLVGENDAVSQLKPIASLKGLVGPDYLRDVYAPDFGSTCGPTPYPRLGETAIFYGRKLPWWRRLLNWGQPEIISVLPLDMILDPKIPTELRAAATRLRKTEPK